MAAATIDVRAKDTVIKSLRAELAAMRLEVSSTASSESNVGAATSADASLAAPRSTSSGTCMVTTPAGVGVVPMADDDDGDDAANGVPVASVKSSSNQTNGGAAIAPVAKPSSSQTTNGAATAPVAMISALTQLTPRDIDTAHKVSNSAPNSIKDVDMKECEVEDDGEEEEGIGEKSAPLKSQPKVVQMMRGTQTNLTQLHHKYAEDGGISRLGVVAMLVVSHFGLVSMLVVLIIAIFWECFPVLGRNGRTGHVPRRMYRQ